MTFFQAFHIHRPALDGVVFHDLSRPLAELYRPLVIHLEPNGNNHLKVVVVLGAADLTISLSLNCQVFLDSCLRRQLAVCINPVYMLRNRLLGHIIQRRHHFLSQPDIFVLIAHFKACIALPCGRHKGQIFCRRAADRQFFFLFIRHITAPSLLYLDCMQQKSAQSSQRHCHLPGSCHASRSNKVPSERSP